MKALKKLRWTLFDRTIEDDGWVFDKFGLSTAIMINYPKIWRIGIVREECGCSYRWPLKNKKVLFALECVKERMGLDDKD